ncbi:hypothetical protein HYX03_00150 [Candidatus Woesearchaeota archaeon]|nr:hypothetical protein [Candidatus Woesearchaeota archaeon]
MNKEKYLHFVASFLIVLVLTLPFYTTNVYATISKITAKGGDGIEGYAKSTDFLNFNVQASISSDTITNDQVVLGSDVKFDSCAASLSNGSECTLKYPSNGTDSFELKSVPFTVNLYKDDKTLDDSKSSTVTIDNKAPQVALSVPQSKFSSQQSVVVNYDVTDYACDDSSCSSKCVGIKNIEFYTLNGAFKQTINPAANDCNFKSSISIDPKTFDDGRNSVFAKATDKFNQVSSETSVTFTVDSNGPSIVSNSFEISRKGVSISTFSSLGINVDVLVNISGNDLSLSSVTADLSALNPSQNLKNAKASCTLVQDELSTCKWSVELNPKTSGLKTFVVNASDTSGNRESAIINKLLSIDDKGPVVLSLSTGVEKEGQPLAKSSGNTVIATFDEATGLSPEDVFLNVGNNKIMATSCGKETNWFCVWSNVNFAGASSVSVDQGSLDILGIDAAGDVSLDVTIDNNAPVLRSINISPVGGLVQAFAPFFKIGDKIAVVANLTEDNDVIATADFSRFVSGASNVAGSCETIQADEHICTWLTDSINLQASDVITFNFSDNAGNSLIVTKSLKTFGLENATVPDFWTSTVECSPETLDRSIGTLTNQRVFCLVSLRPKSLTKPVSTVFIGPASCSGDTSIIQSMETFNTEVGSTSPVIKLTLKKSDFKIDNASLSCSFQIFSKIGTATDITKNPEIENARISLGFFNLPLGELSEEVQNKIDQAKKDAEGIWKIISALNKLAFYAKKICQLFGIIYNILAIYYTITVLWAGKTDAECSLSVFGFTFAVCPLSYSIKTKSCFTQQTAEEVGRKGFELTGNTFCKFVNCQWAPWILEDVRKFTEDTINNLPGAKYFPGGPSGGPGLSSYMNPQTNLVTATLFACIPGIIYSLDKYRQTKCLYADCLQNAVGKEGLPVTACEDQKAYATCKYVTGEIFALIPYTAVLDHFMKKIKEALSNPFTILGAAASAYCYFTCPAPPPTSTVAYTGCAYIKLFSTMGEVIGGVKSIIDEGFKVRQDYCSRLSSTKKTESTNSTIIK